MHGTFDSCEIKDRQDAPKIIQKIILERFTRFRWNPITLEQNPFESNFFMGRLKAIGIL